MPNSAGSLFVPALVWYVLISLVTLGVYVKDKRAAKTGQWRTPETTLHLLSLAGGWPGALMAQRFVQHKSRKFSFLRVYGLTVVGNLAVLLSLRFVLA